MSDANEQSIPSRGSRAEPVAYYVRGSEYDTGCEFEFVTLSREHAEAAGGTVKTLVLITDEERKALATVLRRVREDYFCGRFSDSVQIAAVIDGLLERTKLVGPAPVERPSAAGVTDVGGAGPANVACDTKNA
jgi:hypothetical protein